MPPFATRFVSREELEELAPRPLGAMRFTGLYVSGSLEGLSGAAVAVVGTRACSAFGRRLAHELGKALGAAGVCVLSGLALGIDAAAHRGALAAGGPTVAVIGGGHEHFFPRRNLGLAEAIVAAGGAVVSPFEPHMPARPAQFLQRNAVVAALADGTVIVEAPARSGALNTASWTADLGRPVMAYPGDVDRPKVAGCLSLIRDGATLVRSAADVFEALGLRQAHAAKREPEPLTFSPVEANIVTVLREGEVVLDEIVVRSGKFRPEEVLAAITSLEIAGVIERRDGALYALARAGDQSIT